MLLHQGSEEDKADARKVLVAVLEAVRVTAILLAPVTPGLSRQLLQQLGVAPEACRWVQTH